MKWKKVLLSVLAAGLLCSPTSAKQANDDEYQAMLENRHFAVEFKENNSKEITMIASDGDNRIVYTGMQTNKGVDWTVEALCLDGKLYRFFTADNERKARVLPLSEINRPDLDPDEKWPETYRMMALPKGLAPFAWNDAWGSRPASVTQPIFNGSSQRTIGRGVYDCDQYTSEIQTQAGTTSGMIAYNLLYRDGKLSMVQRYLLWDGNEKVLDTLYIRDFTKELPEKVFTPWSHPIKVYKADEGDFNDLMDYRVQVGELGGTSNEKK